MLIDLGAIGDISIGYLSICENGKSIPFDIKRSFWSYFTPHSIVRGRHAHYETEMVLVAVAGRIVVTTEMHGTKPEVFVLESPSIGLYLPPMCWHTMQYSHSSVQLVLASTLFDEADYIRDYEFFKRNENNT